MIVPASGLPAELTPWAERAEQAYIADALGKPAPQPLPVDASLPEPTRAAFAAAAAAAVAARYLSVGKPRSLGIIAEDPQRAYVLWLGHRVWHQPVDVRWAGPASASAELLARCGGRAAPLAEALTADVVCVDVELTVELTQVRRGSHLTLVRADAAPELAARAICVGEAMSGAATVTLGELAAGLRDGRQLDEITLLLLHGPAGLDLARRALALA